MSADFELFKVLFRANVGLFGYQIILEGLVQIGGECMDTVEALRHAAEQGDVEAQYILGNRCRVG